MNDVSPQRCAADPCIVSRIDSDSNWLGRFVRDPLSRTMDVGPSSRDDRDERRTGVPASCQREKERQEQLQKEAEEALLLQQYLRRKQAEPDHWRSVKPSG